MKGRILSIEIGSLYTRIADLKITGKTTLIKKAFVVPTPVDAYEDGFITDRKLLAEAIQEKLSILSLTKRRVAFTISSSKIINREIVLPYVSADKVNALVMANASSIFPVDVNHYKVSWKIIKTYTEDKAKKMKLFVIAAPEGLLESLYDFAEELGMIVQIIDYAGNSICELTKNFQKSSRFVSLNIGDDSTIVSILKDGLVDFQRIIPLGYNSILLDLAQSRGEFNSVADLKEISHALRSRVCINSMLPDQSVAFDAELDEETINRTNNTEGLRTFVDRVETVIHYYTAAMTDGQIEQLILTGIGANIKNLGKLFQNETGLPVRYISSIEKIAISEDAYDEPKETFKVETADAVPEKEPKKIEKPKVPEPKPTIAELSLAVGCAIDPMDMRSAKMKKRTAKTVSLVPGIVCALASIFLCFIMAGYSIINLSGAQSDNTRLKNRIEGASEILKIKTEYEEVSKLYKAHKEMIISSRNPNENLVGFIEELEEKMPESAQIEGLNISVSGATFSVVTGSWREAADAIYQLKHFDCVNSVLVSSVTETSTPTGQIIYVYYVNGVKVNSLYEALELGSEEEIVVEEALSDEEIKSYSFSAAITWKELGASEATQEEGNSDED